LLLALSLNVGAEYEDVQGRMRRPPLKTRVSDELKIDILSPMNHCRLGREQIMNLEVCRPPGLVVAVIVTGVAAAWEIFWSGLGLIALFIANVDAATTSGILFLFVLGVSTAVTAHGLWYFERWAPRLALIVYPISIIILAAAIAVGEGTTLILFLLVLFVWMLFFVFTKKIRTLYVGGPSAVLDHQSKDSEPALQPRDRFFS
jgi:hypothetical protein